MAQRSSVIPLPILNADEKKYDDCVAILRAYENWIYKVYKKADSLNQVEGLHLPSSSAQQQPATDPQVPSNSVRQVPSTDLLADVLVSFGGDQLTRAIFDGAKTLLAGAHTRSCWSIWALYIHRSKMLYGRQRLLSSNTVTICFTILNRQMRKELSSSLEKSTAARMQPLLYCYCTSPLFWHEVSGWTCQQRISSNAP